jgi:hypothetical protein
MSWYRTGTVTVTNGSKTVTGVGTLWTTAVNAGDAFALVDANLNPTGAWYEVESVTNNTTLVLKQSYAGTTGSNKQYCVFNLVGNMTTPSFAQRLATFFASFQSLIDKPTTTPTALGIPIADANGNIDSGWIKDTSETVKGVVKVGTNLSVAEGVISVPDTSTTVKGVVELATAAEAAAGADTTRAITPSVSGSRLTFATTSTDDMTSATDAPLKSAGGLAVAKKAWLNSLVLGTGGVEIRSRLANNAGGAGILGSPFGDVPVLGFLFVTELETSNYLIATFFKRSASHSPTCTVLASDGLSLGPNNIGGTQVINGATDSSNIRMRSIFIKGE